MVASDVLEAAEDGNVSVLQSFGDAVRPGVVDEVGCNCLHYAARGQGGVDVLKFLVQQRGFDARKRSNIGATPLHDAAAAGNLEAVKWLLNNTACDVNDQDGTGATVLHLACRFCHSHVTGWLLENAQPSVLIQTASGGIPLHFAVVGGDYEAAKLLLEEDQYTANSQTENGATPTYLAAQEGQEEILRLLIQHYRGNVKMKAYDGMSSLHAAAQTGHLSCVRFLVEDEKCNPNERDFDGATPLHYCASQGHYKVVDWLMRVGGAKVTLDNIGGSPLHNAAETNQMACVKALIGNGCRTDITDNNGLSAAELARKCYNDKCAHLIETYKANTQEPPDHDLVYLASVQSPRPPITINQSSRYGSNNSPGYHGNSPAITNSRSPPASDLHLDLNRGQPRSVSPLFDARRKSRDTEETGETESVIARVDSQECLVGIPRKFSEDNLDIDINQFSSRSPSSSSLSSLSHLDEVVAVAVREFNKDALREKELEKSKKGTSIYVAQPSGSKLSKDLPKSQNQNLLRAGGYGHITQATEIKSVRFQADRSADKSWLQQHKRMEGDTQDTLQNGDSTVTLRNGVTNGVNSEQDLNSKPQHSNGNKFHGSEGNMTNGNGTISEPDQNKTSAGANGSVPYNLTIAKPPNQHSMHNTTAPYISAYNPYHPTYSTAPVSSMVNGHSGPPNLASPTFSTSISVTSSEYSYDRSAASAQTLTKSSISTQTMDLPTVPIAPPPPPPPPLAPPPPVNRALHNGDGMHAGPPQVNGLSVQEARAKSTSLPARPASLFTSDMIQSKRNSLSPTPAKTNTQRNSGGMDFDFVSELKKATKDTSMLKTTKVGDSSKPKEIMVFSSGQKKVNGNAGKAEEKKDDKKELTGEWDPKNFVDQVPNKDTLPGWKVQLQARQIAEKAMKETLEKRKVEEREARFKNMPAWKRALVEKKEAEAKAAEEKREQEMKQQQQRKAVRKVPKVNVSPKSVTNGEVLSPWQKELQK